MIDLGKWLDGTYTVSEPLSTPQLPEQSSEDSEKVDDS